MAVIKRIWAVILGTCVGGILGIVFDWLKQNGNIPTLEPGTEYAMLYPWIAGGGALFGSILAVVMIRDKSGKTLKAPVASSKPGRKSVPKKAADKPGRQSTQKGGSEIKSSGLDNIKMDHVEGMPGFDFDPATTGKQSEEPPQK